MCVGPLKYMSGIGLASQAIKGGPVSLISPAAGIISAMTKKKPDAQSAPTINPYGG